MYNRTYQGDAVDGPRHLLGLELREGVGGRGHHRAEPHAWAMAWDVIFGGRVEGVCVKEMTEKKTEPPLLYTYTPPPFSCCCCLLPTRAGPNLRPRRHDPHVHALLRRQRRRPVALVDQGVVPPVRAHPRLHAFVDDDGRPCGCGWVDGWVGAI